MVSDTSKSAKAAFDETPMQAHVLILEARFYDDIADHLVEGAQAELRARGVTFDRVTVPGALELPQALALLLAKPIGVAARYDGAVALGCVIRGETAHYDIVCHNANHWLMETAIDHGLPVGNAILTVENRDQAMARAEGGRSGKGGDAARACLRLIEIARQGTEQA